MPSVFAGSQSYNGGFRADQLRLSFGGESVKGLLVQDVQFSFSQQVAMLYEIGSAFVYYVGGRAQGTAQVSQIVGPASRAPLLLTKFRDLCNPQDISFDASAGCPRGGAGGGGGLNHTLKDAVLVGLSVSVTAQNVVITRNVNFMFIDLDLDMAGEGGGGDPAAEAAPTVPTDSSFVAPDGTAYPSVEEAVNAGALDSTAAAVASATAGLGF